MPTYNYRCKNCGHELEKLQKISDSPLVKCPECGKDTLVRIISGGAGMVFKGSGFYLTDYKKSNTSGTSSSSTDSKEKKSDPKPESKTETKTETKSDSKSSGSKTEGGSSTGT